ncbi:FtsX-like permease family protein [Subsaximicrobium wynnwilliamsii]|uniref:FtsX-like permease family protein n=1 Tax=Subsaximicrobium wynnwilliamsii TaxID=291179 RepID=A0A5C6ZGF2_9FLAO|nr:FtsX-like permease family protein [Subsaximicrobium wynnwilliamsii]TXD83180.1 FtsX-like permease family protein [Subsaximicrobium wynnwilliamsii]TXD88293.1 FtsX-like permease family protein [Subsaximicrobium wynnwilliamsii]TXE03014.1 FtsX-like permease family protein [Subsaximicrobium wynnwilliamsii]
MFRNYIKIAWRNISKNKGFSAINVISLAIGLSASFVIGLMVYYDFTFDKFHKDGDLIYRVTTVYNSPEGEDYNYGVSVPLIAEVKQKLTGIQQSTAFFTAEPSKVMNAGFSKAFNNPERVIYADPDFFGFLNYEWLAGNAISAIDAPNKVVLTENRAKKYFPNKSYNEILGETLVYDDSVAVAVTGIVANFKDRTDFTFEEIISLDTGKQSYMQDQITDDNWNSTSSSTQLFVKLNDKNARSKVQRQLDVFAKSNESENAVKYNEHRHFYLQALSELHFGGNYGVFDFTDYNANKTVLTSLIWIAAFLLILGCINFINLNTAQATQRAKEIGIRKTLGSSKKQLIFQFLWETFLLTLFAAFLSILLAAGLIKVFADFLPEGLHFGLFADPFIIGFGMLLLVIIAVLAGFYPAMVLSSFKPVSVLKNRIFITNSHLSLRKGLIVFQFIIAQVFIISTVAVGKQIHFLMEKDMGFKTEAITYIRTPWMDQSLQKREVFIQKLKAIPQIENISLGGSPPASFNTHATEVVYLNGKTEVRTDLELLYGDEAYLNLYDIELLAGRKLRNDTIHEYVINDACRKVLGFESPAEAIGKTLGQGKDAVPIVGVMEDFNQRSLKTQIQPMAFVGDWSRKRYSQFNTIHMQLNQQGSKNWPETIAKAETAWQTVYPESDFKMEFIDQTIAKFYQTESSMTKLLNWATGLSVLISCLGLLGLVIYTTERRVKEIGIRKVLGASLAQLNLLLCKDFIVLVLVAFIVAAPIAYYGLHNWLQDYAYKTRLNWWIFAASGFGIVALALIIMSVKTLSTASKIPVKSLRTE